MIYHGGEQSDTKYVNQFIKESRGVESKNVHENNLIVELGAH